ncbi:MAG: translocation/assembly module TamB domain-containing protein [Pseudomonadota bacterium]
MIRRLVLPALLATALLVPPAAAQLSFLGLQNSLVQFVLEQISVPGEFEVTAEGVVEAEDGSTALDGLAIADADGVWLRIGQVALDWSPSRILRGELDITRLAASDVEYLRAPGASVSVKEDEEVEEDEDASLFDWPRAPLAVVVSEMALERVSIAPGALATQGFAFDAIGNARDEGDEQSLRLQVTRTDGIEGAILLDYLRDFDSGALELTLEADEAAGGLVAELAGLPGDSASRVRVTATGPLSDWRLDLAASSDRVIAVEGALRVGLTEAAEVTADLAVEPGEALDPAARRLLAPRATLALSVIEDAERVIRIERGRIESPEIAASATGFYDLESGAVDLDLDLSAAPGLAADAEGVAFETLALTARVDGDGAALSADGTITLAGLVSPGADVGSAVLEARLRGAGERLDFAVDGDLERIRFDRLGPDLLGTGALRGRGRLDGGVFELSEFRFASEPLRIEAEGRADGNADTLAFQYLAAAERLGPLAAAYYQDAAGSFRMEGRLSGSGAAPALNGRIVFDGLRLGAESLGAVQLTHSARFGPVPEGTIALEADGSRYGPARLGTDFALDGNELALTDLGLSALDATIDGAVTLDLASTLMEGAITLDIPSLERAEAATGLALAGRGGGEVVLSTEVVPQGFGTSERQQVADIDLSFADLAGFEAEVAALGLTGRLNDLLGEPGGDLVITVDDAAHPQAKLAAARIEAEAQSLTRRGSADLRFTLERIAAPGVATIAEITGEGSVTDIERAPAADLVITAREIGIEAVEGGRVAEARLAADLTDLTGAPGGAVNADITTIEAMGYRLAGISAETDLTDLTGAAAAEGAVWIGNVSGPDVAVEGASILFDLADLTGAPGGTVSAEIAAIEAMGYAVARIAADARLSDLTGAAGAAGNVQIETLSGPDLALSGAEITFDLADLASDPAGRVEAMLAEIEAAGFQLASVDAEADLATLLSDPAVVLEAETGRLSGAGIAAEGATLSADLAALGGNGRGTAALRLTGLSGAAAARAITLDADMTGLIRPAGTLALRTEGLAAGGAGIGAARLDATLRDREGRTDVDARLALPGVSVPDAEAEIGAVALTAAIRDALGAPGFDTRLTIASIAAPDLALGETVLTAAGPLSALAIALDAAGEAQRKPLTASLRATADLDGPPAAEVARLDLNLAEARVGLDRPLRIDTAGGVTRLRDLALSLPGGTVAGDAALHPGGAEGTLAIDMRDVGALRSLAPDLPVAGGTFALDTTFDTRRGRAGATLGGQARDLRFTGAVADIGALGLDLDGAWDGRRLGTEIALSGPFGDPFRVAAGLGLVPSGGPAPVVPSGAALDGSVRWAGDVGELWVLVPLPDHVLDGALDIDLTLSGTLDAPGIGGAIEMSDGQYQNLDTGTILTGLTLGSTIEGTDTLALTFSGRDGAAGTLEGRVAVDPDMLDAAVTLREAVLVRRDDVTASISADIAAQGPLTGFDLSGELRVDRAEVRLINALPPSVTTLGEVRIKGAPEPEPREPAGGAITLDLKILANDSIFVRGRGLDSAWGVDLAIGGTAAAPRIVGDVTRARGQLDLLGRTFELETGEILFTGGREIDPTLDIAFSHERGDITGFIIVRGNASDPEILFESDPALPEDEVLPRTVFGRSSQSLSAFEALQLAAAVATLLDGSGGAVDSIRGAAGVDVLRIDAEDTDDVSVTVGKNVTEDVFVGVSQPVTGGDSKVTVEVDVFSNVVVDGEVSSGGDTSIGVQWRKDF